MSRIVAPICLFLTAVLVGCTSAPAPSARGRTSDAPQAPRAEQRKTLTIAAANTVLGFGFQSAGTTGGGARSLIELHSNGLATTDAKGIVIPRLAERMPSFDDNTMTILPDGRLQVTWKLRPNVKWHDGAPFTADDIVLGWKMATSPGVPVLGTTSIRQVSVVEAPDPQTAVITWKTTYYQALGIGLIDLWPAPRHLVGESFDHGDIEAFLNLPYWTTEYVHVGPFRLMDFGFGENLTFQRFDDYFLGRPKIDTIVVKIIPDANTLISNVLAGAVDIATEQAVPTDLMVRLRDQWKDSGEGTIVQREGNWFFVNIQFHPEWSKSPRVGQDVRLRRGLIYGIDREAMRDAAVPGFADTEGDTFMPKSDQRAALVGKPFAGYRFDPTRAAQELADGGWKRDANGRLRNEAGEQPQVPIRATTPSSKDMSAVAQSWRELGIEVAEEVVPGALVSVREYRAMFPGTEVTAQNNGDAIFTRFDGRLRPTPPNFSGNQGGWYANPELDALIDKLSATLDMREQGLVLKEMGELVAADLPMLPLYFSVNLAAVRKGIRALHDDFAGAYLAGPGIITRNAYLWDRE